MPRTPTRSTLFPYTTLFPPRDGRSSCGRRRGRRPGAPATSPRDRKSTRLNSSHVAMSYAVFCLKKKKLTKRFGSFTAIKEVSVEVAAGEIVGFLGRNGAGKTTTIRILVFFF